MKKVLIIVLLFIVQTSILSLHAQKNGLIRKSSIPNSKSLFFAAAGPAYCFGDIGGSRYEQFLNGLNDWDVLNTRYLLSFGYSQTFKHNLGYKLNIDFGSFTGMMKTRETKLGSILLIRKFQACRYKGNILFWEASIPIPTIIIRFIFWGHRYNEQQC
jgi:hypothetical protein